MSILGLIGKLLSGPWMKKLYTSSETEIKYLEGIEVVRCVLKKLQEANKWPTGLLEAAQDFFCNLLQNYSTFSAVRKVLQNSIAKYNQLMKTCLQAIIAVLERQYSPCFSMDLTDKVEEEANLMWRR